VLTINKKCQLSDLNTYNLFWIRFRKIRKIFSKRRCTPKKALHYKYIKVVLNVGQNHDQLLLPITVNKLRTDIKVIL
jgi:hypothetical protein